MSAVSSPTGLVKAQSFITTPVQKVVSHINRAPGGWICFGFGEFSEEFPPGQEVTIQQVEEIFDNAQRFYWYSRKSDVKILDLIVTVADANQKQISIPWCFSTETSLIA